MRGPWRLYWRYAFNGGRVDLTYPEEPFSSWYCLLSHRFLLWYRYGTAPEDNDGRRGLGLVRLSTREGQLERDFNGTPYNPGSPVHNPNVPAFSPSTPHEYDRAGALCTRHSEMANGVCVSLDCSIYSYRARFAWGGLLCVLFVLPPAGGSGCSSRLNKMQSHPQGSHRAGTCFLVSQEALYWPSGLP
jgi:hypothetical protein